ncbi:MAG: HNH endonuclease signature motif containing protein [Bacteroidales bacterium]|nr:HNH endonuclease signature motif containing protein [Bacteroidales bacterium]
MTKKQSNSTVWHGERLNTLIKFYPETKNTELAVMLGVSEYAIRMAGFKFKLKKSDDYLKHARKKTQFRKGNIPANKGQKMPSELRAKVEHTFFKKGHTPFNYRPVGSERVTVDGYVEVKTNDPNIWALKHRRVWETNHGKIAKGFNVQFKDKNRQNCDISNLYIIKRDKQILQNSIMRYAPELRKSMKLISKLNRKIKENE